MKKLANWYWNHEASGLEVATWLLCFVMTPLVAVASRSLGVGSDAQQFAMDAYVLMLLVMWVRCTRTIIILRKSRLSR